MPGYLEDRMKARLGEWAYLHTVQEAQLQILTDEIARLTAEIATLKGELAAKTAPVAETNGHLTVEEPAP